MLVLHMPFAFCISVVGYIGIFFLIYLKNCHSIVTCIYSLKYICIYENYCVTLW